MGDETVTLDVKEHQTSSEDCKRVVQEFVHKYGVLKAETTSLYRYVRSVVQRALMERETEAIVNEISAQHLDHALVHLRQAAIARGVNVETSSIQQIEDI